MIGAGDVVAHGLGRPRAQEDRARVADGAEAVHGVFDVKLEVLGRDDVDRLHGGVHSRAYDDEALVVEQARVMSSRVDEARCFSMAASTASAYASENTTR